MSVLPQIVVYGVHNMFPFDDVVTGDLSIYSSM